MMLQKSTITTPDKKAKQINKLLNQREDDWNKHQNILKDKKIIGNLNKANTNNIHEQVTADLQVLGLTGDKYS